jgi:hypothetical protein
VFTRSGTIWSQQAYLKASNPGQSDEFGGAVSLSADGNTLAVGARNEDSNTTGVGVDENNDLALGSVAVYVFRRTGKVWIQQAYLKASNTGAQDSFGHSVSLDGSSRTLAVGAPLEDSNARGVGGDESNNLATNSGVVYLY